LAFQQPIEPEFLLLQPRFFLLFFFLLTKFFRAQPQLFVSQLWLFRAIPQLFISQPQLFVA